MTSHVARGAACVGRLRFADGLCLVLAAFVSRREAFEYELRFVRNEHLSVVRFAINVE